MPGRPTRDIKQFVQASPVLHVKDPGASARYYRDVLGFTFDFEMDHYAVVWKENAAIHFCSGKDEPSGVHVFLWVEDVDSLFDEMKQRGATVTSPPETQPYGIRECSFRDPNNVTLIFGQDDEQ